MHFQTSTLTQEELIDRETAKGNFVVQRGRPKNPLSLKLLKLPFNGEKCVTIFVKKDDKDADTEIQVGMQGALKFDSKIKFERRTVPHKDGSRTIHIWKKHRI